MDIERFKRAIKFGEKFGIGKRFMCSTPNGNNGDWEDEFRYSWIDQNYPLETECEVLE